MKKITLHEGRETEGEKAVLAGYSCEECPFADGSGGFSPWCIALWLGGEPAVEECSHFHRIKGKFYCSGDEAFVGEDSYLEDTLP